MQENPKSPSPLWWFVWILSTVGVTGFLGSIIFNSLDMYKLGLVLLVNLICHAYASFRLVKPVSASGVFLILGGYVLMAASFFVGCLSTLNGKL